MQPLEILGTYNHFVVVQLVFFWTPLPWRHISRSLHLPTGVWRKHRASLEAIRNPEKCCQRENQVPPRSQFLFFIMFFLIFLYNLLNLFIGVHFPLLATRAFHGERFSSRSSFDGFGTIRAIRGGSSRRKASHSHHLSACWWCSSSSWPSSSPTWRCNCFIKTPINMRITKHKDLRHTLMAAKFLIRIIFRTTLDTNKREAAALPRRLHLANGFTSRTHSL